MSVTDAAAAPAPQQAGTAQQAATAQQGRDGRAPRIRRRPGPWLIWLLVILVVLGVVAWQLVSLLTSSTDLELQPNDPAPKGAMALVQVLEQHGVDVVATDSLAQTIAAARASDAEVLVNEQDIELTSSQRQRLAASVGALVLLDPDFQALDDYGLDVTLRASVDSAAAVAANCQLGGLGPSDTVTGTGTRYLPGGSQPASSTVDCVGSARRGFGLVRLGDGQWPGGKLSEVTVIGATAALRNDTIEKGANAAFALNALGEHARLIWYTPGDADLAASDTPAPTQPTWYAMVIGLFLAVLLAAALWRGRRLGPLVVERLPVVVPARETVEGRARLYARASARQRALDAIRIASAGRLATLCGLGPAARLPEIIDQTAWLTGLARARVAAALVDAVPHSERRMLELARELAELEARTARAVGRAPSGQTGPTPSEGAR